MRADGSDGGRARLGFTFRLAGGGGKLSLGDRSFFGWLHVDNLELEVPNLSFPVDLAAGPEMFQRRRTLAQRARLRMDQSDVLRLCRAAGTELSRRGVDELEVRIGDDALLLSARVREDDEVADISFQLRLASAGPNLRLTATDARAYGFLPTPAPLIAHRIVEAIALSRLRPKAIAAHARGLCDFELQPLRAVLWHTFPAAGWRLPDTADIEVLGVELSRGQITVDVGPATGSAAPSEPDPVAVSLEKFREADAVLLEGDAEGALRAYRGELAARGEHQLFLVERILSICTARRAYFVDGIEIARNALGRRPDFLPAHCALAAIAVAQGDARAAAERFGRVVDLARAGGDDAAAARAALAGARLLRGIAPNESTVLYERVLDFSPGDAEATEALSERFRVEGRFADLCRLIRLRIAAATDPDEKARDQLRLGEILLVELGDTNAAREALVEACRLAPEDAAAREALADVAYRLGHKDDAVADFDAAAGLYRTARDRKGEARTELRVAHLLSGAGDDDGASARFHRVLELQPNHPEALRGAAELSTRAGKHEAAAELWRMLLVAGSGDPHTRAHDSFQLGKSLLADGDLDGARPALERAAKTGEPRIAADAHALLADVCKLEGAPTAAAFEFGAAIGTLEELRSSDSDGGDADLRQQIALLRIARAELLDELTDASGAVEELSRAFDIASDHRELARRAAAALYERAAAAGDHGARLRWLSERIDRQEGGAERADLLLTRAELLLASGSGSVDALHDASEAEALGAGNDDVMQRALWIKTRLYEASGDRRGRAKTLSQTLDFAASRASEIRAATAAAVAWLDAEDTDAALRLAARAVDTLESGSALELLDEVADEEDPDAAAVLRRSALSVLGEAAWRARDWPQIVRAYQQTALFDTAEGAAVGAQGHLRLGVALEQLGRGDEALAALSQAASNEGAGGDVRAQAWRRIIELQERAGRPALAAAALERLAADDGAEIGRTARADAWYRAGEFYRKHSGHRADAERCLEEALHLTGDHLPALDALERIKREAEDYERVAVILGRKIAATARHPNRQKSLLARLASLQHKLLGRTDVARETYTRALELDDTFRPALRFVAEDASRRGDISTAADHYVLLSRELIGDVDLPDDAAQLALERREAALTLVSMYATHADDMNADAIEESLDTALDIDPDDDELLAAKEQLYRMDMAWDRLAELLESRQQRAHEASDRAAHLALALERIELLWKRLDDPPAALAATRAALDRHPGEETLRQNLELLERKVSRQKTEGDLEPMEQSAIEALFERARKHLAADEVSSALGLLEQVPTSSASVELLSQRGELFELCEEWHNAAADLEEVRRRCAELGDVDTERRTTRRLAALTLDRLRDDAGAALLYQRALVLDPDDLAAAEACVDIYRRRGDDREGMVALEVVVEIARRTGAGQASELAAVAELSRMARANGDDDQAWRYLDEAAARHEDAPGLQRALAELAYDRGDFSAAAEALERIASTPVNGRSQSHSRGELLLQLADLYYDHLGDFDRARNSMFRAAEAFGDGSRGEATLRLLATEAAANAASSIAAEAYEKIGIERIGLSDQLTLAKVYQRLGRDQRAIEVLEASRTGGRLSDEGAMLLFALHRQRKRKEELAHSLERGAKAAPPQIAATRLLEALNLYEHALGDQAAASRVRDHLTALSHVHREDGGPLTTPQPEDLERAAEAAAAGDDTGVAADLLARSLSERARRLASGTAGRDERIDEVLDTLEKLARRDHHFEALARGLLAVAGVERDTARATELLRSAASIRRTHLHDTRSAADALSRALALSPADVQLLDELDATLREAGDYAQLVSAYELHLGALSGRARTQPLVEAARIYRDVFREHDRARAYLTQAIELAPELEAKLQREMVEIERAIASDAALPGELTDPSASAPRPQRSDIDDILESAAALEQAGQLDAAISRFETAALEAGSDTRALVALERLYTAERDFDAVAETIGRLIARELDSSKRAELWYRRAQLYRDRLRREPEAYRCLKEAFANNPNDGDIANALRAVAMARGEWALAGELLYREIDATEGDEDKAGLYLELALIFDEKLLDAGQAVVNYEQALALDGDIPAAPRPLARLYELEGRHADAARMYELAAAHARAEKDRGRLLRQAAMAAEHAEDDNAARRLYGLAAVTGSEEDSRAAHAALARLATDNNAGDRLGFLEEQLLEADTAEERLDIRRQLLELAAASGDHRALERHARELLEADGSDSSAYRHLRAQAATSGDILAVTNLLRSRASSLHAGAEQASVYYELGRAYEQDLGDINAAVRAFEQAIEADPSHPGALEALAKIAYDQRDWLRARALYEALRPETCSLSIDVIQFRRGEIAEALGREDEAAEYFEASVASFPASRPALEALARTSQRVGSPEVAIRALRALLDLLPTGDLEAISAARQRLAELSELVGEPSRAIYYYELVLSEDPRSTETLLRLVALYKGQHNYVGAASALRSLVALAPTPQRRAELLYELGEMYREGLGDIELAADAYLKAADLDPDNMPTLRRLIDYYWRLDEGSALLEVAGELDHRGRLLDDDTDHSSLARALVTAAIANRPDLAERITEWLGDNAADWLAEALVEAAGRPVIHRPEELSSVGASICARYGIDGKAVYGAVRERADDNDAAAALLAAIQSGSSAG